jgi:superfamily II DNA or RNA helicase
MKVIVNNDVMVIENATPSVAGVITSELSYVDKSKQFQLKRMSRNLWQRNSPLYKKLEQEVTGTLYTEDNGTFKLSSCFFEFLKPELICPITDNRKKTGTKIAYPWVKKPYDLRDYQDEAVQLMLANWRGVINLATGLGKTLIACHAVKQFKTKTLIVCPSESVAKQFYDELVSAFGKNKVGFYGDGKKKINDITVGIAASICKYVDVFKKENLGLIIIDETHHTPANTFFDIAVGLSGTSHIFGLTATDYRSDGKDIMITGGCGPVLIRRDTKWGVANGWLAEPYFIVREVPTTGKDHKSEKLLSYKEHVLNSQVMKDRIQSDAAALMKSGKSVLILVDEVAHGKELSDALGIPFATGEDSKSQSYVDDLNAGKVPGLVGTDGKIGEGSDTKNVDALILANFVASKGPVTQCVGRALRKQGTKTKALILDYVPKGSTMLTRHARQRIQFFLEITDKVKVITC